MIRPLYDVVLTDSYFPAVRDGGLAEVTIGDALSQAAADAPELIALKESTPKGEVARTWTYRELEADAKRLARVMLKRHHVGDRIAVWGNNIPEWILLEYAAAYAGMVLVTLNPSYQAREARYVLEQSGATALYHVDSFRGNPIGELARRLCEEITSLTHRIDLGNSHALFEGPSYLGELPRVQPRDAAHIQYTSGTTGFPKGAVLGHQGLVENARLAARRVGLRRGDVWLNFMPLFHTAGCGQITLGILSARATMVLAPQFEAQACLRLMESERVTCVLGVPTMVTALIEAQHELRRDVSSMKSIISGGATVAPELVRRARETFGCSFQISYGQTETSPVLCIVWPDASIEDIALTVGQPLEHTEISIRDTKTNGVVPVGTVGEICARGYNLMLRYNDDPSATSKTIDSEGWLHTGDLGIMDARGYVRVTGRVKEMIIRGGENLYPVEIENVMLEHPALAEVAVVGIPDDRWGEVAACFMRPRADAKPSRADLIAFVRERLSPQKTPTHWVYVESWPLTGSGKIRKFVLREQFLNGAFEKRVAP